MDTVAPPDLPLTDTVIELLVRHAMQDFATSLACLLARSEQPG
jgi:hypothetical protein